MRLGNFCRWLGLGRRTSHSSTSGWPASACSTEHTSWLRPNKDDASEWPGDGSQEEIQAAPFFTFCFILTVHKWLYVWSEKCWGSSESIFITMSEVSWHGNKYTFSSFDYLGWFPSVCVRACLLACVHAFMSLHACVFVRACVCVCTCVNMCVCLRRCKCACLRVCVHTCILVCVNQNWMKKYVCERVVKL